MESEFNYKARIKELHAIGAGIAKTMKRKIDAKHGLFGNTRLIEAVIQKDEDAVRNALGWGADVNKINNSGYTALMYAAKSNFREGVRMLLEKGADVNACSPDGSALILAVQAPVISRYIVEMLIESGANPLKKDHQQKTAIDYARLSVKEIPPLGEEPHAREAVVKVLTAAARKQKCLSIQKKM